MKQLKNLLPLMLLALLAWNCQKDEEHLPSHQGLHFLENKFSLEDFNDPFIKDNLKVNWDNYAIEPDSLSNALIYQFDTSIKGKVANNEKQFEYKYQVLGQNQGTEWDFEIIRILANNAASVKNVTYLDLGEFSGTINLYDLKGNTTKSLAYEKGELVSEMTGVDDKVPTLQTKEPEIEDNGVWVLITVERYTDWYYDRGGYYEYAYSTHNSTQHEWAFISTEGTHSTYGHEQGDVYHGHHAGPSAPVNSPDKHEEEYVLEDQIIYDNQLLDCHKAVLMALLSTPEARISEILNDFSGEGPGSRNYDWRVKTGNLGIEEANAQTEYAGDLAVTIINNDRMDDATDIKVAATFIHEAIHAWLSFYFNREEPNNIYDEYVEYYNAYIIDKADANNMGHDAMADLFRNRIKNAIRAYGESKGYVIDDFVYEALAWGGLTEIGDGLVHPKFIQYVPNANTRSQILNILNAERHNQLGFGYAVPKGQRACN